MSEDRAVEPGVWGACMCLRWRWGRRNPDGRGIKMGWDNKLQGRFRVGVGRIVYCEGCGDGCLSGGYVRRNLQREAERMIRCPAKRVPPSDAHDAPTAYARGREDALRELLATGYPTCGEGGHMSPNLPREAERMLA